MASGEEGEQIDDGGGLDLPVKAIPQEGIEEKLAGEDVGTKGSEVKDRNMEKGNMGGGANVDQDRWLASDQEKMFQLSEGLVTGGTSEGCYEEKDNMEGGDGEVNKKRECCDVHGEFLWKVLLKMAELRVQISGLSITNSRIIGQTQAMRSDMSTTPSSGAVWKFKKIQPVERDRRHVPLATLKCQADEWCTTQKVLLMDLERWRVENCGKDDALCNYQAQIDEASRERERLKVYSESKISYLEKEMAKLEVGNRIRQLKEELEQLVLEVYICFVKRECAKQMTCDLEEELHLLSKKLEDKQLDLDKWKDPMKHAELEIRTLKDLAADLKSQEMAKVPEDKLGNESKLPGLALLGSAAATAAALFKTFKRG